ncbi:hypothetical protein [Leifsonia poae]|uniref:hypothetical protein n=1 Tax=Leifsonia poae TaxID=110933 RepID=UPI001CC05E74|nr:hypothetical protein [Leifsonia poae]
MSVRSELAAALTAGLHKQRYTVIDVPRTLDELSPSRRIVQLYREEIQPNSNAMGNYKEQFVVWVLSPKKDQPAAEDDLEEGLYAVLGILDSLDWLTWTRASRANHVTGAQAYKIDLTLFTKKE